jgi:hypothetical protein
MMKISPTNEPQSRSQNVKQAAKSHENMKQPCEKKWLRRRTLRKP